MELHTGQDGGIADELQKIMDGLLPGEKLPSLRILARNLNVSVQVVDRSLARLAASGQVFIKPRSGAFKTMPAVRRVEILVMEPSFSARKPFAYFFFSRLVTDLVCAGRQVRVHELSTEAADEKKLHAIGNSQESLVITFRLQMNQMHVVEFFRRQNVPLLHILPNLGDTAGHMLMIDDRRVVASQLDALQEAGHRRIACLHAADPNNFSRSNIQRHTHFCSLAIERGLELRPEYVAFTGHRGELIPNAVKAFRESPLPPTAAIIYDTHAKLVYDELRRSGIEPGRDIALIAMDDLPWDAMLSPSLSSVRIRQDAFLPTVLEAIRRAENNEKESIQYFELETAIRESLCKKEE